MSSLPGFRLAGEPAGYATRDEFADYLRDYAVRMEIPIYLRNSVVRLTQRSDARFSAVLESGDEIVSPVVIVATGAFQKPIVPEMAKTLNASVAQFTTDNYRGSEQIPVGSVLVVGDGATGRDIAVELAQTHTVFLARGRSRRLFPERILGKSTWWWLRALGLMNVSERSLIGRLMRRTDPFPDRQRNLRQLASLGINVMLRAIGADGQTVRFDNDTTAEISAVVWAIGYEEDNDWLDIPSAKGIRQRVVHTRGRSPVPGLYFLGKPWQRNRSSALIMGAGADAAIIVNDALRHWN